MNCISSSSSQSTTIASPSLRDPSHSRTTTSMEEEQEAVASTTEPLAAAITSLDISREILRGVSRIYDSLETQQLLTTSTTAKSKVRRRRSASFTESRPSLLSDSHPTSPLGLKHIGQLVRHPVSMGHYKAAVMIIGNISAGKSTFINWYVQEAVQKTGMAIETSGFTYITSGRYVTEIGGDSTLALRPQLNKIVLKYSGFLENLSLKTCPSRDGRLHLVDLVDSPGLADGDLQYPFDVEEVIFEMRRYVDLFLVFFDPMGQALSRRMLSIVKKLNDACPDKLRFCLSKIDEVPTEEERIKVMCQTTQSLTAKINSRHGFDLIPIFIPGAKNGNYLKFTRDTFESEHESSVVNRLGDLVDDIQKITERRIQDALNTLSVDVTKLTSAVDGKLEECSNIFRQVDIQKRLYCRRIFLRAIISVVAMLLSLLHLRGTPDVFPSVVGAMDDWISYIEPRGIDYLNLVVSYVRSVPHLFTVSWVLIGLSLFLTSSFKTTATISPDFNDKYLTFLECREFLSMAKLRSKQLNRLYLGHAVDDLSDPAGFE